MKRIFQLVYKGKWSILIICYCWLYSANLYAQEAGIRALSDSLNLALKKIENPKDKVPILKQLVNLYWQQPEETYYLKEIIDIATKADSMDVAYNAMTGLGRYYFNKSMPDSLLYWTSKLDTLCMKKGECPDALFIAGNLRCKNNLKTKNYELAINEAIQQINLAKKNRQPYGMMRANQNMGLIYQAIDRDNDAMVYFREGLAWITESKCNATVELQYLSDMIKSGLRSNLTDETENLLKLYNELISKTEKLFKSRGISFPIKWYAWQTNSYLAELYTRQDKLGKAKQYLEKASLNLDDATFEEEKCPYYEAQALYYFKTGNSHATIIAINNTLAIDERTDMIKLKINVLRKESRFKEAISLYDKLLKKNTVTNDEAFKHQMNQLRTLNDLNDKDKQTRELAYQNEQLTIKQYQLAGSMIITSILLVLLYIGNKYYRRTQHLKDELLCEKESLTKSEKQLRIAKDIAEEANREKSNFISNISYEIRTPLNVILGFSVILSENDCNEEEKNEFTTKINNSAELLMNLVNNVLELSRLESGNSPFSTQPCDIINCCQIAIENVKRHIAPEVKLSFEKSVNSFQCNTDPYRIQQVAGNLLSNAIKFTEQGEIVLSINIDSDNQKICLTVTDTGCGIPKNKQHKIYEYFEKLDEFSQGTGLGLPISQIVANRLGGTLHLDTNYTKETRFIFTFPYS